MSNFPPVCWKCGFKTGTRPTEEPKLCSDCQEDMDVALVNKSAKACAQALDDAVKGFDQFADDAKNFMVNGCKTCLGHEPKHKKWRTKDGRELLISEMDDEHLMNTVKYIERNAGEGRVKNLAKRNPNYVDLLNELKRRATYMANYVCTNCGHRKMDKDSAPTAAQPKVEFLIQMVLMACRARMLELELINEKKRNGILIPRNSEQESDYAKFSEWWNDLGAQKRNDIKRWMLAWSMRLQDVMRIIP